MSVPIWLKGRHLTAIAVAAVTVDINGNLSVLTSTSLSGYVDGVDFNSDPAEEMIQSLDHITAHYEILYEDFSMTMIEILTIANNVRQPLLPILASTYDVMWDQWTRGGGTYTMYGRRGAFRDGVVAFGKNTTQQTIRPIDLAAGPGSGQVSVTYAS